MFTVGEERGLKYFDRSGKLRDWKGEGEEALNAKIEEVKDQGGTILLVSRG